MSEDSSSQPSHEGGGPARDAAAPAPASAAPPHDWQPLCAVEDIPDGDILTRLIGGHDLVVYRNGAQVSCLPNYCPHRGWPFDGGRVRDGVLECPFHGYEFRLDTGECLTSSYLSLDPYPIRIRDGRVDVRLK